MKEIRFYKDSTGWYAEVEGHTKAQNRMILGADKFLEYVDSLTDRDGNVVVECDKKKIDDCKISLKRVFHDFWGAFYVASGPLAEKYGLNGFRVYLCNVVHTVFGRHPKNIYIKEIA